MKNREIYQKDPASIKLVNEGVASVNDDKTRQAMEVLRYELDTFVCDGQYQKGLEHILETYLKNINEAQQPGVWVSGFYGSGKSHLVKMLRSLWIDVTFEDRATARGIADLPKNINDLLKELSTQAKRYGGLHAASGTLGAGSSESVRLALLRIVFKSVDLPEQYPMARFVMWLKNEEIYETVRGYVEQNGYDWDEELDNLYVAEGLHAALIESKPNLFASTETCAEILKNLFPYVKDISSDDMIKAIRQALTNEGKFPLTLIILDEVQQYISESSQRSMDVQEAVEACCKNIGGKLLFIGTGQTAVTGTSNLKKLEGRFTVHVELSDSDVDAVIRKVILAKKPQAISTIEQVMQTNLGEISRHLAGTTIGHREEDIQYFSQDYPILPVRRRFWENTLRVLDQTGTDSQLRNQLSIAHKVIQTQLDDALGHVVTADYLYFDSADKLLTSRGIPPKVHAKTMSWIEGSEDERLMARACGLVFFINRLAGSNKEIGIKATIDTLADLMVEDLSQGSSYLRSKLPGLLNKCELLIRVGDEYRIQTEESAAWNDEFLSQRSQLANEATRIDMERDGRIRSKFGDIFKKISLIQGVSKVPRNISPIFDTQLPPDSNEKICVWIHDGWGPEDERSVRVDALQAGNESPTVFVFIPKLSADDLRHHLMDYKAASSTLDKKGVPNTPEGTEARAAMETTKQNAEGKINELLNEAFSGTRVFQAGGNEILGSDLQSMILEAATNSLQRLYPQFQIADHTGWQKVYDRAKQGSPDALKAVGYEGEPATNSVCKAIMGFIAGGKKGVDIRSNFENKTFGWSRDAVDGGIQVLLVAGLIRAQDERGQSIDHRELERKAIGKVMFKVESSTVTTLQRIQVRKLLQKLGCQVKQGEEPAVIPEFLQNMKDLANSAGGEAPRPERPNISSLDEIRLTVGNEQILSLYNRKDELTQAIDSWNNLAERIEGRWPSWISLQELLRHAGEMKAAKEARQQAETIEHQRLLLADPDLIQTLVKSLEDALRKELMAQQKRYADELDKQKQQLEADSSWKELPKDECEQLLVKCDITDAPEITVGTHDELLKALKKYPINSWSDRIDALSNRFSRARELAAKSLEPKTQTIDLPRRTFKTEHDIEAWIQEVKEQIKTALGKGPVVIR
ncbi:MAG: BREX system P-loop protein BrxC [Methanosarcina sp.]|nr:BREX system P-loop protein BrxC [Methanosarcina sp.]